MTILLTFLVLTILLLIYVLSDLLSHDSTLVLGPLGLVAFACGFVHHELAGGRKPRHCRSLLNNKRLSNRPYTVEWKFLTSLEYEDKI